MTENTEKTNKPQTEIERKAIDKIEEGSDVIDLLGAIDFGSFKRRHDGYEESHKSAPFGAMLRAYYLKELLGYTDTELHRRLDENSDEASVLGFNEEIPARTTFCRTWENRFDEDLHTYVSTSTKGILEYAHDRGNPLGFKSLETEVKEDVSTRTESRHLKNKTLEVSNEIRDLVYKSLDLDRPQKGTQYDTSELLGLESLLCNEACAATVGSDLYSDNAPSGVRTPDGDTLLHYIKQLDIGEILELTSRAINAEVEIAKSHLEFNRPVEIAIDMTYNGFYGMRGDEVNYGPNDDKVVVMGAPPSKSFDWCYKFATASIVGDNVRLMIAAKPHVKGESIGDLVRELYWQASEHVRIKRVYADAEFYSAGVVEALEETNSEYIIRVPRDARVKRKIARAKHDVWVENGYGLYGQTVDGPSNDCVETTLVGVPNNTDPSKTVVFATNLDVKDEISLDRRETERRINAYSRGESRPTTGVWMTSCHLRPQRTILSDYSTLDSGF